LTLSKLVKLITLGGVVAVAGVALLSLLKYRAEERLFFPAQEKAQLPVSESGLAEALAVQFPVEDFQVRGWYVPSKNRAAVILCHGAGANRASLAEEARALSAVGFGTLLFDWPGHGESGGVIRWDEGERATLRAAVRWLAARPEVDRSGIGAYGFSMGGYVLSQVSAENSDIRAIVLAGTPAALRVQVHFQHGRLGALGEWPALYALSRHGLQVDERQPIEEVPKLAPRPLLLIGGTRDPIVGPTASGDLFGAALQPKDLYSIEGAGHGDYVKAAGNVYLERLVGFFRRALLVGGS
jgi:pimeloyl-ACP methyl ester carboxylesterase